MNNIKKNTKLSKITVNSIGNISNNQKYKHYLHTKIKYQIY